METRNLNPLKNNEFVEFSLKNQYGAYHVLLYGDDKPVVSLIFSDEQEADNIYAKLDSPRENIMDDTLPSWIKLNLNLGSIGKLHTVQKGVDDDHDKYIIDISSNDDRITFQKNIIDTMVELKIIPSETSALLNTRQ